MSSKANKPKKFTFTTKIELCRIRFQNESLLCEILIHKYFLCTINNDRKNKYI